MNIKSGDILCFLPAVEEKYIMIPGIYLVLSACCSSTGVWKIKFNRSVKSPKVYYDSKELYINDESFEWERYAIVLDS